jgi:hypothetical protein
MRLVPEPTTLVDAVADPKRREAETAIRQPEDTIVYVEGGLDRAFFRKHTSAPNLTFTKIGKKKGKLEILSTVSKAEYSYGIVDMDYDFDSTMVVGPRLVDTSQQCCLYSYVTLHGGSAEITDLAIKVVQDVCQRQRDPMLNMIRNQMIDRLRFNRPQFENFVAERTKAKLYRGHLGKTPETRAPAEGECNWSDVESSNGNPVRDLITDAMSQGYELFKQEYSKKISAAGVNDHAISDAIILLFKDQYPGFQDRESKIKNEIDRELNRLTIGMGNSDMANYFLSELGLIVD